MKHYLGPGRPLTELSTWDQIEAAATGGLLDENQWCELKEQLGPTNKAVNLELARDLAALSVHGGLLIFGITDKLEVVGCEGVNVMKQRIAQVSHTAITPPLTPTVLDPIEGPDNKLVLIVSVPPSPLGPHMVDGHYWGRSDHGKVKLSDPDIRLLMSSRGEDREGFKQRLLGMVETDPLADYIEGHPTGNGHVYLHAEPVSPARLNSDGLDLRALIAGLPHGNGTQRHTGHLGRCIDTVRDPDGATLMSRIGYPPEVVPEKGERYLCSVSVHESPVDLQIVSGSGSAQWKPYEGAPLMQFTMAGTVVLLTLQMLELLRVVSLEHLGFTGAWHVGLHMNHLKGRVFNPKSQNGGWPSFLNDEYTRTTITNALAAEDDIEKVMSDLLSGYLRGLGLDHWTYEQVMEG